MKCCGLCLANVIQSQTSVVTCTYQGYLLSDKCDLTYLVIRAIFVILPGSLAVGEGHAMTSNLCYTGQTRSNYLGCLKMRIVIEAYPENVSDDTKITFFTHQLALVHLTTLVCDWLTIAKHYPHHFMVFRTSVHK